MTAAPPPHSPAEQVGRALHDELTVGRWPFRLVERDVVILTEHGNATVPLVLWINRDSLLCGGLFFFGDRNDCALRQQAASCARTLGQEYFLLGDEATLLVYALASPDQPQRGLPLPQTAIAANTVLQQLKLLSLPTGNAEPPRDAHFATLCYFALTAMIPLLDERRRETQALVVQAATSPISAPHQATLVLWRLMALAFFGQLPAQLRPEELQSRSLELLAGLPPTLRLHLALLPGELTLPSSGAVRLHHLFHRLTQLRFFDDRQCGAATIAVLVQAMAPQLGVARPPLFADGIPASECLFADRLVDNAAIIAPQAVVAALVLQRGLRGEPSPATAMTFFAYRFPNAVPRRVCGTLIHAQPLGERLRREVAIHLRRSWPTRRFRLTAAPVWFAELLHLLGCVPEDSRICLQLPRSLVLDRTCRDVLGLIADCCAIQRIEPVANEQLLLELRRLSTTDRPTMDELRRWFAAAATDDDAHSQLWARLFPGHEPHSPTPAPPPAWRRSLRSRRRHLDEEIVGEVFRDGIPRFPEHYLYDYFRPALDSFAVAPPIEIVARFFDRYHLRDAAGTSLTAESAPLALALLLAGYRQDRFALPHDESLVAAIVARYRRDLFALHTSLRTTVYRHIGPGAKGERLIREIWNRFDLPPHPLFTPGSDPLGEGLPLSLPSGI